MRSTLVPILALAILSLCARAMPVPSPSSPSSPIPPSPPSSALHPPHSKDSSSPQHQHNTPSTHLLNKREGGWKRPVALTAASMGLAMTLGWNYVAYMSYKGNKEKWEDEQRRREAEKNLPPPKVGDVYCTIETYYTMGQVDARKPSKYKVPCYRLGVPALDGSAGAYGGGYSGGSAGAYGAGYGGGSAAGGDGGGNASPMLPVTGAGLMGQVSAQLQQPPRKYANVFPYVPYPSQTTNGNKFAGGLTKRAFPLTSSVEEITEEVKPLLDSTFPRSSDSMASSSSSAHSKPSKFIDLFPNRLDKHRPTAIDAAYTPMFPVDYNRRPPSSRSSKYVNPFSSSDYDHRYPPTSTYTSNIALTRLDSGKHRRPSSIPDPGYSRYFPSSHDDEYVFASHPSTPPLPSSFRQRSPSGERRPGFATPRREPIFTASRQRSDGYSRLEQDDSDGEEDYIARWAAEERRKRKRVGQDEDDADPKREARFIDKWAAEREKDKDKEGKHKVSTDDIVFGLTILNTLGNIPSLTFTLLNAYYYRGNPKVD